MTEGQPTDGSTMKLLVRDYLAPFSIGILEHERRQKQNVRINVEVTIPRWVPEGDVETDKYVSYSDIVISIRRISEEGHINYVETLGERIIESCFKDERVLCVKVTVEKIDAFPEAMVGVELVRSR